MKRTQIDESKLVKKYYIERAWYSRDVHFSIVYGTVGSKEFMIRRRDDIVGSTSDVRIRLDSSNLFDDFLVAAEQFKSRSLDMREKVLETLSGLDEGISKVGEFISMIEEEN
jgi:hypothetical protein